MLSRIHFIIKNEVKVRFTNYLQTLPKWKYLPLKKRKNENRNFARDIIYIHQWGKKKEEKRGKQGGES